VSRTSADSNDSVVDYCRNYSGVDCNLRTKDSITRHAFMYSFANKKGFAQAFICGALIAGWSATSVAQVPPRLRVGLVTRVNPESAAELSIVRGARLGAAEARQTANLFGGDVQLFEESDTDRPEHSAQILLAQRKVQILIASSARDIEALSRFAQLHHLIFFNVASRASSLRLSCRRYTFHVEASDTMYANATNLAGGQRASVSSALLWAPTLERYGASQINNRYRAKYGTPMDGGAWAGWVAVKIAGEAALRARSSDAAAILSYLESPSTNFDGHKGWPLSFRPTDHQLRQPLYVAQPAGPRPGVRDIPELGAIAGGAAATNANQALDRLMPKSAPRCAWNHR
jgi:ABC-type branched-subunit amino acid transport system substrate-binding protein